MPRGGPMTATLALLVASGGVLLSSVVFVRWVEGQRNAREQVSYELHFPKDIKAEAVQEFVSSLSGLLPPWWKRLFATPVVIFEVQSDASGIRHQMMLSRS